MDSFLKIFCEQGFGGYRYAPEVAEEVREKLDEIAAILSTGRTLFFSEARAIEISQIKAPTAAADPGLRAFISTITASVDQTL